MTIRTLLFAIITMFTGVSCSTLTSQYAIPPTSQALSSVPVCAHLLDNDNDAKWDVLSDNRSDVEALWGFFDRQSQAATKKRKLLVFIDGTNNTKAQNTNIWKLYTLAVEQGCAGQPVVPYYREGVGADFGSRVLGALAGVGTDNRIQNAYSFLVQTYRPGDEIFIFGFSRGAFIARSLNGFVEFAGLLKNDADDGELEEKISVLYAAYNTPNDGLPRFDERLYRRLQAVGRGYARYDCDRPIEQQFRQFRCGEKVKVTGIGVYDTVPALGLSRDDYPDDHRTNLYADSGYHAMAIDEQRNDFRPLRFGAHIQSQQTLEEVWFAGAHADVGGGEKITTPATNDREADDNAGLQWLTRRWMMENFAEHGLFAADPTSSPPGAQDQPVLETGELHDEFLAGKFFFPFGIHWRIPLEGEKIHCSVLQRLAVEELPKPLAGVEIGGVYRPENIYQSNVYPLSEVTQPFDLPEVAAHYTIVNDQYYDCSDLRGAGTTD